MKTSVSKPQACRSQGFPLIRCFKWWTGKWSGAFNIDFFRDPEDDDDDDDDDDGGGEDGVDDDSEDYGEDDDNYDEDDGDDVFMMLIMMIVSTMSFGKFGRVGIPPT